MFTACGFLSVSNLSLLRLSPTRLLGPTPLTQAVQPAGGGWELAELWVCVKEEPIRDP